MNNTLEKIADIANREQEIASFGKKVARVLLIDGMIDDAVYETLVGEIDKKEEAE